MLKATKGMWAPEASLNNNWQWMIGLKALEFALLFKMPRASPKGAAVRIAAIQSNRFLGDTTRLCARRTKLISHPTALAHNCVSKICKSTPKKALHMLLTLTIRTTLLGSARNGLPIIGTIKT